MSRTKWLVGGAIAAVVCAGLIGRLVRAEGEAAVERKRVALAELGKLNAELDELAREQEAAKRRIASSTFKSERLEGLDGQCAGRAKPKLGYLIQGSTYADNVVVGRDAQCEPLDGEHVNVTNFFCCTRALPATFQVTVLDGG